VSADGRGGSVAGVPVVSELDLPTFDYTDPAVRGERFHTAMAEVQTKGWLAQGPFGYIVLDHQAAEFFLRSRDATFPGLRIAELFELEAGALREQIEQPREPRAVPASRAAVSTGDAHLSPGAV